jgi:hypothetical protein
VANKDTNIKAGANSVESISPLLKEVYPKPRKKKGRSNRFDRIARMLHIPKDKA